MNDVLGHIVFTTGDEDLGAGDFVGAIGLRFCPGAHHAEICTRMGFGQRHGSRPFTAVELFQIGVFLFRRAVGIDAQTGTHSEGSIQKQAAVGRPEHFLNKARHALRHTLATKRRVTRQA